MPENRIDLILHPIRMRIIAALGGRTLTPQQIAARLPDVAQATLYRHISALADGGVLQVIEERPIRGTVEKVYALQTDAITLSAEDLENASKEDHIHYFTVYLGSIIADFMRYLNSTDAPNFLTDGVGYHTGVLYMSDEDVAAFGAAMQAVLTPYATPAEGRKRRLFSTIFLPSTDDQNDEDNP